ncbi:ATP-binding protein [Streptomyces sp. NPDC006314]|uniref:ATP-binding protein n=1 Tax=Streptomyces sp. NPDC006314 TaxID=3154475 RepID=UPI0033AFFD9D
MGSPGLRESTRPRRRIIPGNRSEAAAHARGASRDFPHSPDPPTGEEAVSTVEPVVSELATNSELVTNAVRHARGDTCVLELDVSPDTVSVSVHDDDPAPPRTRIPDYPGAGGFGRPMARRLADEVTVTPTARGKRIRTRVLRVRAM